MTKSRDEEIERLKQIEDYCHHWANNCGGCEACVREFSNPPLYDHQETLELIAMIKQLKSERDDYKLALEFYCNAEIYDAYDDHGLGEISKATDDDGQKAREALAKWNAQKGEK